MDYAGFQTLIAEFGTGDKNTALEFRIFMNHLINCIFQPGDIKAVYCTEEDLANDYDETGLGLGKRAGWARCNGLNGTQPIGGRTIIGHSDTYPEIGAIGGSANAVVVEHSHEIDLYNVDTSGTKVADASGSKSGTGTTSLTGESGVGKNMQPYIVLLYIQKL